MKCVPGRVLVVDDEPIIAALWCMHLTSMGLDVCGTAGTAEAAVALAAAFQPELILMDMRLRGDKDGVDAAHMLNKTGTAKIIFITGSREAATLVRMKATHPQAVLYKPVSDRQLQTAVMAALEADADMRH